jgi:hypothetical protein
MLLQRMILRNLLAINYSSAAVAEFTCEKER